MKGTDKWSVGAGIVMILGGAILIGFGFAFPPLLFYGIPILIIGAVILATLKEQEKIEMIKPERKSK